MGAPLRAAYAKRAVRQAGASFAILLLGACATDSVFGVRGHGSWKPGTASHDITVGPLLRNFLLHVPLHHPLNSSGTIRPYPLLVVLHGSSSSAEDIRQASQMDSLSEVGRFLVAYPNGVMGGGGLYPSDWNAGACCGAAARENIDDVGFIAALIRRVARVLPVDQHRIYIAGFSDGGRMAYHAACQLAPTIAAIGVVSGSLLDDHCAPSKPVAVIAIHGTSDDQVPYYDVALTPPPTPVSGVAAQLPSSVQFWIARNGCSTGTVSRPTADVVQTSFGSCLGADVVFYTIESGLHAWPSEPAGAGSQPPMNELAASRVITEFFARQIRR